MVTLYPDMAGWPTPVVPELHGDVHDKSVLDMMLRLLIPTGPPPGIVTTTPGKPLFTNLVRLTDKAVHEYEAARVQGLDFAANQESNTPTLSPYYRAIDHFENCINALHRALLFAEGIRKQRDVPEIDRTAWRALQHAQDRINGVRDAVEHNDERLRKGDPEGLAFLVLGDDALQVADKIITYPELAQWIHQTYRIMRQLLEG